MSRASCKHFTGVQHVSCKAGVRYAAVRGKGLPGGLPAAWPCLDTGVHLACDRREMPTPEEVAADDAETERIFDCYQRDVCPDCGRALTVRQGGGVRVGFCETHPKNGYRECGVSS